jgi:proteasome accessory factor C
VAERKAVHQAADKLAFLLSLVPYLMDHDQVGVADVAKHFGVPEEQIRDAVKLIAVSGVPGATGTYQHGDLFDLAWDNFEDNDEIVLTNLVAIDDSPRFSGREAAALIAGLQYLSSLPENADRGAIASLMDKLSRGASTLPSQMGVEGAETDATLALIRESVAAGLQVEFDYLNSRGEQERRRVDPLRIESMDADWYLRGWCHVREAVRTFRLDRISNPLQSTSPISFSAKDVQLPDTLFQGSADDFDVTLDVASAALPLLSDYIGDAAVTPTAEGRVITTIRVAHLFSLKRLVAGMPGVVRVVTPGEGRQAVAQWAAAALEMYEN